MFSERPPDNFFVLPRDPRAWMKLKEEYKKENMVICVEFIKGSEGTSNKLFIDLAREFDGIPFLRVEVGPGFYVGNKLCRDFGGVQLIPAICVIFFNNERIMGINCEGLREIQLGISSGKLKETLKKFTDRRVKLNHAKSLVARKDKMRSSFGYMCRKNVDEEEAIAEAKVCSPLPQDLPYSSLFGVPLPSSEHEIFQIQRSKLDGNTEEGTDGGHFPYLEGEHWIKGERIGRGASCFCFKAKDVKSGTVFAVKQVSTTRNEILNRLTQEVTILGRLDHPNVVQYFGATQHNGYINVFMEWMAGGCLDDQLAEFQRPFSEDVACDYIRQVTYGIAYLHKNGVIHRDLKGGNILFDSTGRRLRIADFGSAARLVTKYTGVGEFQQTEGTVAFMAPEVVRGGIDETGAMIGYGRKCDVWSIGCVIIQMLTAKYPWDGTYDKEVAVQLLFKIGHTTEPPPMPVFDNPSLKDFTIHCLEVKPKDRPTSSELLKHPLFTTSA